MKGFITLIYLLLLCMAQATLAKTYDINNYGAEADGKTLNTLAIQKAVNACTPGDTVLIPAGRYLTGTVHLKSNITLYLEKESVLIGSTHLADYETNGSTGHYGILYTTGAQNINIAGRGIIEGNSQAFLNPAGLVAFADTALMKNTRQQGNYRNGLTTPAFIAPNHPPGIFSFIGCKNISIINITLLNAAGAAISIVACEGISVSGISIESPLKVVNVSGMVIEGCKQITVNGCGIRSGGDAMVIRGLSAGSAQSTMVPSQNIAITDCALQSSSTAINITAFNQASVSAVKVSHVNIMSSGRGVGLLLRNAGSLENMSFNDLYIETKLGYGSWEANGEPIHMSAVAGTDSAKLGVINGIAFNNVFCVGENQILVYGSAQSMIQQVQFNDVVFQIKNSAYNDVMGGNVVLWGNADKNARLFAGNIPAIAATYITGLSLNNVKVSWPDSALPPYFTAGIQISNFKDVRISRCLVKAASPGVNTHAIALLDGSLALVDAGDVSRTRVQENKPVKSGLKLANQKTMRRQ
jgi:polygalacturonase